MFNNLLNQSAVLQTWTPTVGTMGEPTGSYEEAGTFPCYIEVVSQNSSRAEGRDGVRATHLMFAAARNTISQSDRVICDGRTYTVLSVEAPRKHHLEVYLTLGTSKQTEP